MKTKKTPERMCSICRSRYPKRELLRLLKTGDGLVVDVSGKQNGRGAYICASPECLNKLRRTKILKKMFNTEVDDRLISDISEGLRTILE